MKTRNGLIRWSALVLGLSGFAASTSYGGVPNVQDSFEGYANGTNFFVASISNWQASSSAAYVTNSGAYGGGASQCVFMGESVALSNTLNADSTLSVWTHLRIQPRLGLDAPDPATNGSSFVCYFNSNGYVSVYGPSGGALVYSNDVWGGAVLPATNSAVDNGYVLLSVWQNYNTHTQAVFLRNQLLVQDFGFVGSAPSNSQLVIQNTHSNCWVDDVWVKTNYDSASLTANGNGDAVPDADELNAYGYVSRRLYVSSGQTNLANCYLSITNAVAAWRPRDVIHVIAGTYSGESVTLAVNPSNVVFEGDAFTVNSLTVPVGASMTLSQALSCTTLTVSGQVAMASGMSLTSTTAQVVGTLSLAGNDSFVVTNLNFVGSGQINFTNAQLVAIGVGVVRSGTFTASASNWGVLSSMPLSFNDNFDGYADNEPMTNFNALFNGWNASAGSVMVQSVAHSGKAVVLPDYTVLSNSISSATDKKIWTDFYIRPTWGVAPASPDTNTSSFLSYVNTNGYLVVAVKDQGWVVCSNNLDAAHSLATPLDSNSFCRVTVYQDLNAGTFAVFIASNLVAQGLTSPTKLSAYSSLIADNMHGSAYLDDVLIKTNLPADLTTDLDGDGTADAVEIAQKGNLYDTPWLAAPTVTAVGTNGATLNDSVTNSGGVAVTSWGTVWDTNLNPTAHMTVFQGSSNAPFSFTTNVAGFSPGQHYYVRGWASNLVGIAYSTNSEFYAEPMQVSTLTNVFVAESAFIISWTVDASSTGTMVVVRQGAAVDAAPVDGSNYTANASFGGGIYLGNTNYIVYVGSGSNVMVNSFVYGMPYHVAAFAFSGSGGLVQYQTNNVPVCVLRWPPCGSVYTIR